MKDPSKSDAQTQKTIAGWVNDSAVLTTMCVAVLMGMEEEEAPEWEWSDENFRAMRGQWSPKEIATMGEDISTHLKNGWMTPETWHRLWSKGLQRTATTIKIQANQWTVAGGRYAFLDSTFEVGAAGEQVSGPSQKRHNKGGKKKAAKGPAKKKAAKGPAKKKAAKAPAKYAAKPKATKGKASKSR